MLNLFGKNWVAISPNIPVTPVIIRSGIFDFIDHPRLIINKIATARATRFTIIHLNPGEGIK